MSGLPSPPATETDRDIPARREAKKRALFDLRLSGGHIGRH